MTEPQDPMRPNAPTLTAADRTVLLDWLAALLSREPTPATIAALAGPEGDGITAELSAVPDIGAAFAALVQVTRDVRAAHATDEAAALTLAGRFGTLFLGAGGRSRSAHPHASVYRDGGRTHGSSEARAAAFLALHNLSVAETIKEPADHIAVMLAGLATLADRETTALEQDTTEGREQAAALAAAQQAFAVEELAPWLPDFRARVETGDPSGFHAAVARLTERVVESLAAD